MNLIFRRTILCIPLFGPKNTRLYGFPKLAQHSLILATPAGESDAPDILAFSQGTCRTRVITRIYIASSLQMANGTRRIASRKQSTKSSNSISGSRTFPSEHPRSYLNFFSHFHTVLRIHLHYRFDGQACSRIKGMANGTRRIASRKQSTKSSNSISGSRTFPSEHSYLFFFTLPYCTSYPSPL
jgi:hypothetical protein